MPWPDAFQLTQLLASAGLVMSPDSDPEGALDAAISEAGHRLNRTFGSATEARRFDGSGGDYLRIPPCSAITLVELLDAQGDALYVLDGDDYLAYPLNAAVKTGLKPARAPYRAHAHGSVVPRGLSPEASRHAAWPKGHGNVRITATWGEEPPDQVSRAVLKLAALELLDAARLHTTGGLTSRKDGDQENVYGQNTLEGLKKTWSDDVDRALAQRRRILF